MPRKWCELIRRNQLSSKSSLITSVDRFWPSPRHMVYGKSKSLYLQKEPIETAAIKVTEVKEVLWWWTTFILSQ